jgi:hypothetical protein
MSGISGEEIMGRDALIEIEPGDAVEHGLPAARIRMELNNVPLSEYLYVDSTTYFVTSGPPGGPLFVNALASPRPIGDPASLEKLIVEQLGTQKPFTFGGHGQVSIRGTNYPSAFFYQGSHAATTVTCVTYIAAPPERASVPGLLLMIGHFGLPGSVQDCEQIARNASIGPALQSLTWDLAIDPSDRKKAPPHAPVPPPPTAAQKIQPAAAAVPDIVEITPDDARENGLPPVHIAVDITDSGMNPGVFVNPQTYLFMSGPPGGSQFFAVLTVDETINDGESFVELVRKHNQADPNFTTGERGYFSLKGTKCPSIVYFSGKEAAAAACCAVFVGAPDEAASKGLLILFGDSGLPGPLTGAELQARAPFKRLFESLVCEFVAADEEEDQEEAAGDQDESASAEREPAPPRPMPTSASPAELLAWMGEIRTAMQGMGCWSEGMPTAESFTKMSNTQRQMWSVQATLQSLEPQLKQALAKQPNEPVFGLVEMVKRFGAMLQADASAAAFVKVIERGPTHV